MGKLAPKNAFFFCEILIENVTKPFENLELNV